MKTASQMIVYSLAKAFSISPMEVYKMPSDMIMDFLSIHSIVEDERAQEMDKQMKSQKGKLKR
tara:strand:+ start:453 stop:641 length:189 start_codon:yes stop_codon:yes gene_type:complete